MKSYLFTILFLLVIVFPIMLAQPRSIKFYMIGSSGCGICRHTYDVLKQLYGEEKIVFHDISRDKSYLLNLKNISKIVEQPLWEPYTAIFINNRLVVMAIGYGELSFWKNIVDKSFENNTVYVYNLYISVEKPIRIISNTTEIEKLYQLFNYKFEKNMDGEKTLRFEEALPIIVASAIADSINPCTFSVFTALLLITISLAGLKRMYKVGISFIAAVFISYVLMGLGLIYVLRNIPYIKTIIGFLAIIVGAYLLFTNIFIRYKTLEPKFLKKRIESTIERAVNPLGSFIAGIFVSFTLLPCTSGPYFVAMAVISVLSYINAFSLLMIYNIIFIAPLVFIFLGIYFSTIKIRSIKRFRTKNVRYLSIVEALLLMLIGAYVILISG